jgi:hypothetical protein
LLAAERRTGELAGVPYACLDAGERRELVDLARAAYELDTTHIEKYCDPPP